MFDDGDLMAELRQPEGESITSNPCTTDEDFQSSHDLIMIEGAQIAAKKFDNKVGSRSSRMTMGVHIYVTLLNI